MTKIAQPMCMINKKNKIMWQNEEFIKIFQNQLHANFEEIFAPHKLLDQIKIEHQKQSWQVQHSALKNNHILIILKKMQSETVQWWHSVPLPIGLIGNDGVFIEYNNELKKLLNENLHKPIVQISNQLNLKSTKSQEIIWQTKAGMMPIVVWVKEYADKKLIIFEQTAQLIYFKNQAQNGQHLQILGQFACAIIHDFNNLLTAISGLTELLENTLPNNEILEAITQNTLQAGNLAKELMNFVKMKPIESKSTNPSQLILSLKLTIEKLLGSSIKLEIQANEQGVIPLSDTQLEQIILNMIINSKDAMEKNGGTLKIHLNKKIFKEFLVNGTTLQGTFFVIEISDTGNGISKDNQKKIFTPFFSTKEKGTGIGLASCLRIAQHIGGTISFVTNPAGTKFSIYIPVTEEAPLNTTNKTFSKKSSIVLVEDEEIIRNLITKSLSADGHEIEAFGNATDALKALKQRKKTDILITDAVLPDFDGLKLAGLAQKIDANIKIVLISGYNFEALAKKIPKNAHYIAKPFTLKVLKQKLGEITLE